MDSKPGLSHVEDEHNEKGKDYLYDGDLKDAREANMREHSTTLREALHDYRWAIIWSLIISMSVIMEGYDTILVGSFYGYPAFQKQFGHYSASAKSFQVGGRWQAAMGAGTQAGAIVGAFLNGWLTPRFGYKPVFIGANVLMISFIFVSFFGKTVQEQTAGQILCGVPWGIFATIGPAYASELLPLAVRPYLTSYTNMCFCIGQFIGAGVLQGLIDTKGQWSYRIPFAIQWIWPPFLLVAGFFMPESPYWYIRKGQIDAAERVMQRVMAPSQRHNAKAIVAMMEHTNAIEMEITEGTSYIDCFRGVDRRRTEIACVVFLAQITCGIQFAFSATYFFEQAGLSADNAYKLNLGGTAIAFVGTLAAWFLINHFGRRILWLTGFVGMCAALLIIGFLTLSSSPAVGWAQAAFCLVWLATFSTTGGPIGWMIPAEISSTRLRPKTVVLARNSYYIGQTVSTIIEPYMVNPTAWNWKGKTGFFWFGTAIVTLVWGYFRLPETKDRTYEELDIMFASKLPTRKFKHYKVNAYDETVEISERAHVA